MRNRLGSPRRAGWMSVKVLALLGLAGGAVGFSISVTSTESAEVASSRAEASGKALFQQFLGVRTCPGDMCVDPNGNCIPCPVVPGTDDPNDTGTPGNSDGNDGNGDTSGPDIHQEFNDQSSNWGNGDDRGSHPIIMMPVELSQLSKLENTVDLTVSLPGEDFKWTRMYSSFADYTPGILGHSWMSNGFLYVESSTNRVTVYGQNREDVEFVDYEAPAGVYKPRGLVTQEIREDQDLDGYLDETGTVKVWTLTEPGKWEIDFYDDASTSGASIPSGADGRMLQYRDAYGNTRTYEYETLTGTGNTTDTRLTKIYLNGTEAPNGSTDPSDAVIELTWFDIGGSSPDHDTQLDRVEVVRKNGGGTIVTQWVDYDYDTEIATTISDDVGDSADVSTGGYVTPYLVQVKHGTLVDEVPASLSHADYADGNYYVRFTQYRYHDDREISGEALLDSDDLPREPQDATGRPGALKAVFTPEQIEYLAQQLNDDATAGSPGAEPSGSLGSIGTATYEAAEDLLAKDDDADFGSTGISPHDLAVKYVSYHTGPHLPGDEVAVQWIQADCGCAGGGSTNFKRMTYDILYDVNATIHTGPGLPVGDPDDEGKTVVVKEYAGTSNDIYREYRYDMVYPRSYSIGAPYIVAKAMRDHSLYGGTNKQTDNNWWVWYYDHNFESDGNSNYDYGRPGDVVDIYSPSAMASYTPATSSTAAAYSAVANGGFVRRHEYNSARRPVESSTGTLVSGSVTVEPYERTVFPTTADDTTQRSYLPLKVERNRTGAAWSGISADDVEVTEYAYYFADSITPAMSRVEMKVEAELVSENGPGVQTYDTVAMFNDRGQLVWTTSADGSMTYRGYDATTGSLTDLIQNADPTGSSSSNPAFVASDYGYMSGTPSGWGTNSSGGELETEIEVDMLGRWTKRTSPSGVETVMRRDVVEESKRPGVAYMSSVVLPHKLAGSSPVKFDGPAARIWMNAKGEPVRGSTYAIDGTATYTPGAGVFTLDDELTRVTNTHDIHGQVVTVSRWTDIASDECDVSTLEYDAFGRIERVTDAEGSETFYEYDAIDRLISIGQSSTEAGATDVVISEALYDPVYDSGSGTYSQGIGNGVIGRIEYHTAEPGSGGLSSATRVITRTHDYRNRLIKVEMPEAPHYAYEYDNLDRLMGSAIFSASPGSVSTSTNRGWLSWRHYSQRGRVYKTQVAIDASASTPDYLESHVWYDEKGRTLKSHPHSSPATKYAYDALDRVTDQYLTDARSDPKGGASGNHSHADDVASDTVFEQTSYTYTENENLLDLVERRVRNHDATAYGAIAAGDGVTTWKGFYYDDADRRTHMVDFGTTQDLFETGGVDPSSGGSPVWPPSSAPSATSGTFDDDDYIVMETIFNERGLVDQSIDAKGDITKYLYDDAERVIATIEAYDNAALDSTPFASGRWQFVNLDDDKDRVTSYVYNGVDDVVLMAAHLPDGSGDKAQVTEYTYGVEASVSPGADDSLVYNNRLLLKAVYPDETTGDAGSGSAYEVLYSYNALGELRSVTDQNGTLHVYERDSLGRATSDRIDAFVNTDLDDTVQRIEFEYDSLGRVESIESRSDETAGMGSVLNGVTYEYTPLWQLSAIHQDMDGVASTNGTGGTETVEYIYDTEEFDTGGGVLSPHNYSRLDDIVYPSDSVSTPTVSVRYGATTAADNYVSRVIGFDADGLTNPLVQYEHLGYGRVAEVDYAVPDVQLDRTFSHEGKRNNQGYSSQSAGVYPGWDRFGRVRVQAWVDGDLDEIRPGQSPDPNASVPGIPPIIEELHTYDRASIRTGKIDARPGAKRPNRDYDFGYDDLDRLTSSRRGSWNDAYSQGTWTQNPDDVGNSEAWAHDALGNWNELLTDGNYDDDFDDTGSGASYVDLAETRGHNMANELEDIDENQNVAGDDLSFLYDHAGNRTKKTYVSGGGYDTYIYDAWNRLVKIERTTGGGSPTTSDLAVYEYNGLHHRIIETSDDQTREMYYGADWRLLEEHVDEPSGTTDREIQHFWGKRYIDDAVMHRVRDAGDETWSLTKTFYHLTDPMYSTLAIIDGNGDMKERVYYSSYGVPTVYRPGDVNGDGAMSASELSSYYAVSDISSVGTTIAYSVELDINRDGEVDSSDISFWSVEFNKSPLGIDKLSDVTVVDNRTGYDGYRWEPETLLWHVRHRALDPYLGRWLQRDPLGYIDSLSLYEAVVSGPLRFTDPYGMDFFDPGDPDLRYVPGTTDGHRIKAPIGPGVIFPMHTRDDYRHEEVNWPYVDSMDDIVDELWKFYRKYGFFPEVWVLSCHGNPDGTYRTVPDYGDPMLPEPYDEDGDSDVDPVDDATKETLALCRRGVIWACNQTRPIEKYRKLYPGIELCTPVGGGYCGTYDYEKREEYKTTWPWNDPHPRPENPRILH